MRRGGLAVLLAFLAPGLSEGARQPGKDGPLTVAAPTIVNTYAVLAANAAAGATSIAVNLPAGGPNNLNPGALTANDLLLIIQMQGVTIDTSDTAAYGAVTNYNNAGKWEFVTVSGPGVGGPPTYTIPLDGAGLRNSYTAAGRVQVIKVPQYTSVTIDAAGSITSPTWFPALNTYYGGVVALDVQSTITINGNIRVAQRGFWGAPISTQVCFGATIYRTTDACLGAEKGEGIAGSASVYDGLGGRYGRGAPANGGGGGNAEDAAGGGGANASNGLAWTGQGNPDRGPGNSYDPAWLLDPSLTPTGTSSGGGRGGYSFSVSDQNALTTAPGDPLWLGDERREVGGLGGHALPYTAALPRVFMGGGGGAGYDSNGAAGGGGRGAGILFLFADTVAGTGAIFAFGGNGGNTTSPHYDGPGGGGAGGTVIVQARTSVTLGSIDADGGDGGNQGAVAAPEAEGGGGGGGGGYIHVCAPSVTIGTRTANGGANGTTLGTALAEFPPNGGTRGAPGVANAGSSCIGAGPSALTFTNVTTASGLGTAGDKEGGLAWGDYNNDGCLDALVNLGGAAGSLLYTQATSGGACLGTFTDGTACLAPGLLTTAAERSAIWGDYDNDGYLDFARSDTGLIEVWRNGGPGAGCGSWNAFTLTHSFATLPPGLNAEGLGFIDYDQDGDLDLVADNGAFGIAMLRNQPTGTLAYFAVPGLPVASGNGDYLAVADGDADGDVDLLVRKPAGAGNEDAYLNSGAGSFAATAFDEAANNANKGGVALCDFDSDGDFDVVWTDAGTNQIWRNDGATTTPMGALPFAVAPSGGELVDGVACGDVDNDGDVDLALTNGANDYLLRNNGGFSFTDVTPAAFGATDGEGNAFGDYDRDGDLDLLINQDTANELWRNEVNDKNYLMVRALHDVDGAPGGVTRDAIGAVVSLRSCAGAVIAPLEEVNGGQGHGSQDPAYVHFGLRRSGVPTGPSSPYLVRVQFVGGAVVQKAVVPSSLGCYQLVTVTSTDADDLAACAATEVVLESFGAVALDSAVELEWKTASELRNLGFHVHRSSAAGGPWTRITSSLVPGLGSSPIGRSYSFRDAGLTNGVRYFYELEDVDASGVSSLHGPVSAAPLAGAVAPSAPADPPRPDPGRDARDDATRAFGDPSAVDLRVLRRTRQGLLVELRTGGFYATADPATGRLRVTIPSFEPSSDPEGPALPLRRALLDAVVGRKARIVSVRSLDLVAFPGLVPQAEGFAEMAVSADGTVRARRRPAPLRVSLRALLPEQPARLAGAVFLGDEKKLVLELSPLRFDPRGRRLVLARRLRVLISFGAREPGERGAGARGRREPGHAGPVAESLLAFIHVSREGLQALAFEELFPGRAGALALRSLKLSRKGVAVPFHVEPRGAAFGPGGVLFFHAGAAAASTAFSGEIAYSLSLGADGVRMAEAVASPLSGAAAVSWGLSRFEQNRFYQPGLLDAPDPWLWEALVAGSAKTIGFSLAGVETASPLPARLFVALQGASDVDGAADHHLRALVNGVLVGEVRFDGQRPAALDVELAAALLKEGANELRLENTGAPGVASFVFLDRFALVYPQASLARGGRFEGTWGASGTAAVAGFAEPALGVVEIAGMDVRWLRGVEWTGTSLRFRAEVGRTTLAATAAAIPHPRVSFPAPLPWDATTQADYILIAPKAFLEPAQRLLERRQSQGLKTLAVSLEEIAERFGDGEASGEAIRGFLVHAFHHFSPPSPRYVVLLGGSTYDPRHFLGRSRPSPLPALVVKTAYLWTVSDPTLAAVNGDDALPDLAIGRLPASSVEEAQRLVDKLLGWEDGVATLDGRAVLVADNPDAGGDFEANQREIQTGLLAGRETELLFLRQLGPAMRPAILAAFNAGAALMSYVGHGGAAVWASENVLNSWDAAALLAQSRQPLLLTLNCLNGYFLAPAFDSLAEAFLKPPGRGSIAAFSPSGLSLDAPAHLYHRALVAELVSRRHERLGDALLAAQKAYAETGAMPELLSIYHLLGDPATKIQD